MNRGSGEGEGWRGERGGLCSANYEMAGVEKDGSEAHGAWPYATTTSLSGLVLTRQLPSWLNAQK